MEEVKLESKSPRYLGFIVGSLWIFFSIRHFGMIQFGGADMSALINAAHRVFLGQIPYVDFVTVAPPAYFIGPGLAFKILGPTWTSIIWMTALYGTVLYNLIAAIWIRLGAVDWIAFLAAFAIASVCLMSASFWHYNQITAITGALFASSFWLLWKNPTDRFNWVVFPLALGLLATTKPNTAGLLIVGTVPLAFVQKSVRKIYFILCLVAAVGTYFCLAGFGITPLNVLKAYTTASGRVFSIEHFIDYFYGKLQYESNFTFIFAGPLFYFLVRGIQRVWNVQGRTALPQILSALLFLITGLIAMGTNNEHNQIDLGAPIVGVLVVFFSAWPKYDVETKGTYFRLAGALVGVSLLGLIFQASRWRVLDIGERLFYEKDVALTPIQGHPAVNGLMVGPTLASIVATVDAVLKDLRPTMQNPQSIFFGPRIEFGFAAWDVVPTKGLALWWMGTGEGSPAMNRVVYDAFVGAKYELAIFINRDYTYVFPQLVDILYRDYDVIQVEYLLFHRRKKTIEPGTKQ